MVNFLACEEKTEESCEKILKSLLQDFKEIELPKLPCLSLEDNKVYKL